MSKTVDMLAPYFEKLKKSKEAIAAAKQVRADADRELVEAKNTFVKTENEIKKILIRMRTEVTTPSVAPVKGKAPAGKAHRKVLVCGINGCSYETSAFGMSLHRKACLGQVYPCGKCGKDFMKKPSAQRSHNSTCTVGDSKPVAFVPMASAPVAFVPVASAPAASYDSVTISPVNGAEAITITSSSMAL